MKKLKLKLIVEHFTSMFRKLKIKLKITVIKIIYNKQWDKFYDYLSSDDIMKSKKSDTLFIFGSGYSVNRISTDEFRYMEQHNTLSFNWFIRQEFLKVDFHLMREFVHKSRGIFIFNERIELFRELIKKKFYKNTVFLLQYDMRAEMTFELLMRFIFPVRSKIYGFVTKSRSKKAFPSKNLSDGLIHSAGTLTDCISFAYSMKFTKIVFVGVDLYDRRYFWLNENEARDDDVDRGANHTELHNTADPMLHVIKSWNKKFKSENITMYTYNSKSLLAEFLPTYKIV